MMRPPLCPPRPRQACCPALSAREPVPQGEGDLGPEAAGQGGVSLLRLWLRMDDVLAQTHFCSCAEVTGMGDAVLFLSNINVCIILIRTRIFPIDL